MQNPTENTSQLQDMKIQLYSRQENINLIFKRNFNMLKAISVEKQWRDNGFGRQHLWLTRHVAALNLSHES